MTGRAARGGSAQFADSELSIDAYSRFGGAPSYARTARLQWLSLVLLCRFLLLDILLGRWPEPLGPRGRFGTGQLDVSCEPLFPLHRIGDQVPVPAVGSGCEMRGAIVRHRDCARIRNLEVILVGTYGVERRRQGRGGRVIGHGLECAVSIHYGVQRRPGEILL